MQLNCSENQLSSLPESLKTLTHLEDLNLYDNNMATLPALMSCFTDLRKLDIGCNPLNVVPEVIRELPLLENLYLFHTSLAQLPDWISELQHLEILNLRNNQLRALPEGVEKLYALRRLWLSNNQLTSLPDLQPPLLLELDVDENPLQRLPIPSLLPRGCLFFKYTSELEWDPQELLSQPYTSEVFIRVDNRDDFEEVQRRLQVTPPYVGPNITIDICEGSLEEGPLRACIAHESVENCLARWVLEGQPEERREEVRDRIMASVEERALTWDLRDLPVRSLPHLQAYDVCVQTLRLSYHADMDVASLLAVYPFDIEIETANEEEARQLEEALYNSMLESPREKYLGPTLNVIFTKTVEGIPHRVRDSFEMSPRDGEWITIKTKVEWRVNEDLGAQIEVLHRPEGEERRPFRETCTNLLAMVFEIVPVVLREDTTIKGGLAKIYKFLEIGRAHV